MPEIADRPAPFPDKQLFGGRPDTGYEPEPSDQAAFGFCRLKRELLMFLLFGDPEADPLIRLHLGSLADISKV
jgi:hypothetical protein